MKIILTDIKIDPAKATNPSNLGELANSAVRSGKKKYASIKMEKVDQISRRVTFSIPLGDMADIGIAMPKDGIEARATEEMQRYLANKKLGIKVPNKAKK